MSVGEREPERLQDHVGKTNEDADGHADEDVSAAGSGPEWNRDERHDQAPLEKSLTTNFVASRRADVAALASASVKRLPVLATGFDELS